MQCDTVIGEGNKVLFSGSPEDTKAWIVANRTDSSMVVAIGDSDVRVSIETYLRMHAAFREG
jgi:hypothetical protein